MTSSISAWTAAAPQLTINGVDSDGCRAPREAAWYKRDIKRSGAIHVFFTNVVQVGKKRKIDDGKGNVPGERQNKTEINEWETKKRLLVQDSHCQMCLTWAEWHQGPYKAQQCPFPAVAAWWAAWLWGTLSPRFQLQPSLAWVSSEQLQHKRAILSPEEL